MWKHQRAVEGAKISKKRVDGIRWSTPKTSEMEVRTSEMVGGQGLGKKGRRDVGRPEKDKTQECGPDQTPVSDLTAGVGRVQISRWTESGVR